MVTHSDPGSLMKKSNINDVIQSSLVDSGKKRTSVNITGMEDSGWPEGIPFG